MTNKACPKCKEIGKDKDNDHLWLMEDGITWTCRTKNNYHPFYYERNGEQLKRGSERKEDRETLEEVSSFPLFDTNLRGIKGSTFVRFEVRVGIDESTGEDRYLYFPIRSNGDVVGYHRRDIKNKRFINIGTIKGRPLDLFGMDKLDSTGKKIVITEGHFDALSVWQVLKEKYPEYNPNIVSVNNGTGSFSDISNNREVFGRYQETLLCFDVDTEGKNLTNKTVKLLGNETKLMQLKSKDANEALTSGLEGDIISSFFHPSSYVPSGIVKPIDIIDKIIEPVDYGLTYPWEALTKMTYGLLTPSLISLGGGPGVGKSSILNSIVEHLVYVHKVKVGLFPLEEPAPTAMKKLIGSIMGQRIHLPGAEYDDDTVRRLTKELGDNVYVYDHVGYLNWEDVMATIRFMQSLGIFYFFIDPLTSLVAHLRSGEANDELNKIFCDCSSLIQQLNISIFIVSHLNNPTGGSKDHSTGARVLGSQFTGSRAAWRYSTDMIGLSRDLSSSDEMERNTVTASIIKNRLSGDTGSFNLVYNANSGRLVEEFKDEGDECSVFE